jgi:hypothetical protein
LSWLIGHFVGDFLLQSDWMAFNKKEKTLKGELACQIHVIIWTLSILLFTGWCDWAHIILVYLPHYLLDRTKFVYWYVDLMNLQKPAPWLYIVNDGVLHLLILYLIDTYV